MYVTLCFVIIYKNLEYEPVLVPMSLLLTNLTGVLNREYASSLFINTAYFTKIEINQRPESTNALSAETQRLFYGSRIIREC